MADNLTAPSDKSAPMIDGDGVRSEVRPESRGNAGGAEPGQARAARSAVAWYAYDRRA
ncbi:hypothetical protein Axi01nite_80300 [Actinoplanes xinjiangensis]|nr:hypothetical protein Axi01nite_80300 [Actinoplanes xinjiangensis]